MREFDRPEIEDRTVFEETQIDLPEIPLDTKSIGELQMEAKIESLIDSIRKDLRIKGALNNNIYKRLKLDAEGYLYYDDKRISSKRGKKLLSVKTLRTSPAGREFLQMLGFDTDTTLVKTRERELETVAREQTMALKAKADSFKATEDWAKIEKDKAQRQLKQATDVGDRQKLQETISYFERIENEAKARYSEVASNQIKRINDIVNDRSRSLAERLKELFRRDGVTIGALITAIGMTISTIVLSVLPTPGSGVPSGLPPTKPTNPIKQVLVKVANLLLDLAKKAILALPGALGSLIGLLFKKAAQTVLFLSEHLLILLFAAIIAVAEFIIKRRYKT